MRQIQFFFVLVCCLTACSPSKDRDSKGKLVSIDKTQIDIARMNQVFKNAAASSNWFCYLLNNPEPGDEAAQWKRIKEMSNRPVQFTTGTEVLATGTISGILTSQDKPQGLSVTFPSPQAADELERKLGIQRQQIPPSLK